MDDLMRMVRENYEAPTPPTSTEMIEGRRRLDTLISPKRRVLRARWAIPGIGLAAAATAAAILATSLSGGANGTNGTTDTKSQALGARQILLAAAQQAVQTPVGTYWRTYSAETSIMHVSGGYNIETSMESQDWVSPSANVTDVHYSLGMGARPLDLAAWKRAGSPTSWPLPGPKPGTVGMTSSPGLTWRYTAATKQHNDALFARTCAESRKKFPKRPAPYTCTMAANRTGGQQMSQQQVAALASHPEQIRPAIIGSQMPSDKGTAGVFTAGLGFLQVQPMPPASQAAVYRYLATLSGVRAIGKVKDVKGHVGDALAVTTKTPQGDPVEAEALFDPATHRLSGMQDVLTSPSSGMKQGTVVDSDILLFLGWTNDTPAPPANGISENSGN
jgi:hypothetical protein